MVNKQTVFLTPILIFIIVALTGCGLVPAVSWIWDKHEDAFEVPNTGGTGQKGGRVWFTRSTNVNVNSIRFSVNGVQRQFQPTIKFGKPIPLELPAPSEVYVILLTEDMTVYRVATGESKRLTVADFNTYGSSLNITGLTDVYDSEEVLFTR